MPPPGSAIVSGRARWLLQYPGSRPEYNGLKDIFETENGQGCPLGNAHGAGVDSKDLVRVLGQWGPTGNDEVQADLDRDGTVGSADLLLILGTLGRSW